MTPLDFMETIICTKCGLEKSLTEFNFKIKAKGLKRLSITSCERDKIIGASPRFDIDSRYRYPHSLQRGSPILRKQ